MGSERCCEPARTQRWSSARSCLLDAPKVVTIHPSSRKPSFLRGRGRKGVVLTDGKNTPVKGGVEGGKAGGPAAGEVPAAGGAPVTAQCLISPVMPWMQLDDWPYGDHSELAVLQASFSTVHLRNKYQMLPEQWLPRVTSKRLVARQQPIGPRPAFVPWEYGID